MSMPRGTRTRTDSSNASQARRAQWRFFAILIFVTLVAYAGVDRCGFVNLDDDAYVEHQPMVNAGLRRAAVGWAFSASHSGTWHPLASLSHALDCELFGVRPRPMHWVNVLLHVLNALLVFVVWRQMFGVFWRAVAIAFVFALHPLNVESVAWISERKNVLSTQFWLLGLLAYARYARSPSRGRLAWVAVAFALGLLSKPMLVTFPCVLLLLDFWPLQRWQRCGARTLLREKLPLFALSFAASIITVMAQAYTGATDYGERFSLVERAANAIVAYGRYLLKLAWPESLSAFYWHPGEWPLAVVAGASAVLTAISLVAWQQRGRRPWLLFGWLWFLGTLVPVIGVIQSGAQSMADRYAYVPALGIFTAAAWFGAELTARRVRPIRPTVIALGVAALAALLMLTHRQVGAWQTSETLYRHSIAVGEDNAAVRYLLANSMQLAGRPPEEVSAQYRRALELQPDYVNAITQLAGLALMRQRPEEAKQLIEESLRHEPQNPRLHHNLGSYWVRVGRPDEAVRHYEEELRLDPKSTGAHQELGNILWSQQRIDEATAHFAARARFDRWDADAQCDYGIILLNARKFDEAYQYLERALWINPEHARARDALGTLSRLAPRLR